jgi:hypothetical protein
MAGEPAQEPAAAAAQPERLAPPAELDFEERKIFMRLVRSVPPNHFEPGEAQLLAAFARAAVIERQCAQRIKADIATAPPETLASYKAAVQAMVQLSTRLRLSPQAHGGRTKRARVELEELESEA